MAGDKFRRTAVARLGNKPAFSRLVPYVWHNPLFDGEWYLETYVDVESEGADPERHYRRHGILEGRDPNPFFDTAWYADRNPDVLRRGLNPLDHYYLFGAAQGLDPSPDFSTDEYLVAHPDVRAAGINPLQHFLASGLASGRHGVGSTSFTAAPTAEGRAAVGRRPSRLLLVVHDAHNHGAQQNALHMAQSLSTRFHISLEIVLLGGGVLQPQFERYGRIHDFARVVRGQRRQQELLATLHASGVESAICNTTLSGRLATTLKETGFRVITLVHELPGIIHQYGLEAVAAEVVAASEAVVFASDLVASNFEAIAGPLGDKVRIRPQGLYRLPDASPVDAGSRAALRRELGVPESAELVLAVGYADLRKGFDLFVDVFTRVRAARPNAVFVWLGCEDRKLARSAKRTVDALGYGGSLRLLPRVPDVGRYYAAADVFVLTSREDPFPSVLMEAMSYGLPVVAFDGASGAGALMARAGLLVGHLDTTAMATAVGDLLDDDGRRAAMGAAGKSVVREEFDWLDYLYFLLDLAGMPRHTVSVVVPNYNYGRYLQERLDSLVAQTYPIREVIVLDDASTDNSVDLLEAMPARAAWNMEIIRNERNAGSIWRQWLRGVERARGELVWIAEADDFAEPEWLERVAAAFDDPELVLAYSDSRQVDATGKLIARNYTAYVRNIDSTRWTRSWVADGREEVACVLAIRNTIPNASAVLFRRAQLLEVLREHIDFLTTLKVAGDYAVYAEMLLKGGRLAFIAESLNNHRRHDRGATQGAFGQSLVTEIATVQELIQEHVEVAPAVIEQASRYLRQLNVQFGLTEPRA